MESRLAEVEKTLSQESTAKEELDALRASEGERAKRLIGFAHSLAGEDENVFCVGICYWSFSIF